MRLHRLTAAGCAAASLALCVATPGAAGAAATSAPIIHETFTLLPCPSRPSSTIQIEGCAEHKVVKLDRAIDSLNAKAFVKLSKAGRAEFATANTDWVSYRDQSCSAQASIYSGGSIQPVAYANCLVSVDSSHVTELKHTLVALIPAG